MNKVKDWVYDPQSEKKLSFNINSLGLRKYLDKKISAEYKGTGVFCVWNRKNIEVSVEKTKKFKQTDFLKGFAKKNVPSDQEMVACLGFAEENSKKPAAAAVTSSEAPTAKPTSKKAK